MMRSGVKYLLLLLSVILVSCKKNENGSDKATALVLEGVFVNGVNSGFQYNNVNQQPVIQLNFSSPIDRASVATGIMLKNEANSTVNTTIEYANNDRQLLISPATNLSSLTAYRLELLQNLKNTSGGFLNPAINIQLITTIDSTDKFERIPIDDLLTKVQQQTFKYFWDFGHPVSGLARERNTSGETVTSGGSGFGVMAMIVAVERGFITRAQGAERVAKIADFLLNKAEKVKGAFSHWINGTTGAIVPFSAKDNGADIVETSLLMQGLIAAREYFDGADATETRLRTDINEIWEGIEWNFFNKDNGNQLYWHYSNNYGWDMNLPISGWNECLITYVLAAASPTHAIEKEVYTNGWTRNGSFVNGNTYYGYILPLGYAYGGPLFLSQYSFLGIDPNGLTDQYTNYFTQNRNHSLINYNHCVQNPNGQAGYSNAIWGLTASDIPNGYTASSPTNDRGVIAPTAALSAMPYTPEESKRALEFFYYVLGDKLWKDYGFVDAFSIKDRWFASSHIAIDQGPIIVMIENYRSGLIWDLFMGAPEVKAGLQKLGFSSTRF